MPLNDIPDLTDLDYDAQNFKDLADSDFGMELWKFMKRSDNLVRMETATYLDRAAVEPLAPGLLRIFGPEVAQDRIKQMIGHMARQIMDAMGFTIDRQGLRITRESMFTTATRYTSEDLKRDRSMAISPEQRKVWLEKTADSSFNRWIAAQVNRDDGSLDLDSLYAVAKKYGVAKEYRHLNPGQQRMTIGLALRARVPSTEYETI
ncbi:hypothetical protein EB230_14390 [Mesorhizobium sp. NZP2234]|uniref:hypothetical protein n=1 Tax=Mesorhizobium sp. NZP2234 TaxID=2483402 RepID=UPI001551CAD1|nr:hypothetical protein [Mesorhizobium sp. NZP2234]QKC92906.1 hypothetical protein EB230_14390 [Mesorhizobium sp. NZP2234]